MHLMSLGHVFYVYVLRKCCRILLFAVIVLQFCTVLPLCVLLLFSMSLPRRILQPRFYAYAIQINVFLFSPAKILHLTPLWIC